MRTIHSVHPDDFRDYQTNIIRKRFLVDKLIEKEAINCIYTHYDRMIIGGVLPGNEQIPLPNYANLRSEFFLERREMGIINVGGDGAIIVDGERFDLTKLDCLYIGKGAKTIVFLSENVQTPAVFYILSAPAHSSYPTTFVAHKDANKVNAGDHSTANERTIYKYIHLDGVKSCQLVMGLTVLNRGSIWNTMPAHVHGRRMEAYFYFDIPNEHRVFHYMGEPEETRHILVNNYEAVVSPPWSIHAGSGTASYSFIWGMAGENLDYTDMTAVAISEMK